MAEENKSPPPIEHNLPELINGIVGCGYSRSLSNKGRLFVRLKVINRRHLFLYLHLLKSVTVRGLKHCETGSMLRLTVICAQDDAYHRSYVRELSHDQMKRFVSNFISCNTSKTLDTQDIL
jgi:hypothetical protein